MSHADNNNYRSACKALGPSQQRVAEALPTASSYRFDRARSFVSGECAVSGRVIRDPKESHHSLHKRRKTPKRHYFFAFHNHVHRCAKVGHALYIAYIPQTNQARSRTAGRRRRERNGRISWWHLFLPSSSWKGWTSACRSGKIDYLPRSLS